MAQLTITVPDAQVARVLAAFKAQYGYSDTVPGPNPGDAPVPNPESATQFVRRKLREYVIEIVRAHEATAAAEAARVSAANAVTTDVVLT